MKNPVKSCERPRRREIRQEIDIERLLIWTYRQQKADMVIGLGAGLMQQEAEVDGVALARSSTCGCATMARIGQFGTRLDRTNPPAGHLHDDAELVHRVVTDTLSLPVAGLVIRQAKAAERPEWVTPQQRWVRPVLNSRGQPQLIYEPWDKHRNYGATLIEWSHSPAKIAAMRETYALWAGAVNRVLKALRRHGMADHRVVAASIPAEPWVSVSV